MVDISMLDVMTVEDFLSLLKNKTENNSKELWKETCVIALQLKAARELLSIAERVYILEVDSSGKELVVTHSKDESAMGVKIPVNSGIEGND
eukprot:scaffold3290_cov165-Ochromonas_danica.AAC.50